MMMCSVRVPAQLHSVANLTKFIMYFSSSDISENLFPLLLLLLFILIFKEVTSENVTFFTCAFIEDFWQLKYKTTYDAAVSAKQTQQKYYCRLFFFVSNVLVQMVFMNYGRGYSKSTFICDLL